MYKPEFVFESGIHKIFCDFEILTEHQIPAKKLDLVLITKKKCCPLVDFDILTDHQK